MQGRNLLPAFIVVRQQLWSKQLHLPSLHQPISPLAPRIAAGLGALPFFFVRSMSAETTGLATAVACGVMLAASFDLVHDGAWEPECLGSRPVLFIRSTA